MSLTLKVMSLAVRTLAKPMANAIKRNAHEHEKFRRLCVRFAQGVHRVDMRMRLGLLQDPAVIDRQIAKEVAAVEAARKKAQAPTVMTEEEMKKEEAMTDKEREEARKRIESRKPRIRPLSESKAIEMGANFVSESFIFMVGISVIVFENWRQRRKAKNQRDYLREDIDALQGELEAVKAELAELKAQAHPPTTFKKLQEYWKAISDNTHHEEPKPPVPTSQTIPQPSAAPSAAVARVEEKGHEERAKDKRGEGQEHQPPQRQ